MEESSTFQPGSTYMFTAKDANRIVHGMIMDSYFNKERLRSYLKQCQQTRNQDFTDVVNGYCEKHCLSPLHISIQRCMVGAVEVLLQFGGDINSKGPNGESPLMAACTSGNLYVVHLLIEAGADALAVDDNGYSCTHYAAKSGSPHILHYLNVTKDVDLKARDKWTNTLLHIAVQKKKIATVNYLIRHEYQLLHMSNKKGNLPLHEACSVGDEKTAILLLRTLDTDMLHSTNNDGQTPLDVLHTCDHPRISEIRKSITALSNQRRMRLLAFFSWLVHFFLPGISLGVAPASYMYLGFPLKYIMPIIVVFGGFFRPIMNHRIPNVMFNWPNPALLGAVLSGYVHTGVCALFFFLNEWTIMFWWMIMLLVVSFSLFHNFWKLLTMDPGIANEGKCKENGVEMSIVDVAATHPLETFCMDCEIVTPEKTKHCRLCGTCCRGFDHHCMWLMRCVGYANHRRFVVFCFLMGLDNFLFVLSSCYYLVATSDVLSAEAMWNKAVSVDFWLTFFILCNVLTGIFAWLNFSEQIGNVSTLRTKYFNSKGEMAYQRTSMTTSPSLSARYEATKLFFLHYDDWYQHKFGAHGGQYCNV